MRVVCLQMDMKLGMPEQNFAHAEELISKAAKENPDVLVLPETWNTGFFPKSNIKALCCNNGAEVKSRIGSLAEKYGVNIVAGSVSNVRDGRVFNTAIIFNRKGECIASYDKTHLFTPMGENRYYEKGDHLCSFTLDGVRCAVIICYDLRFPELTRRLALQGLDILFVLSQWPAERVTQLRSLGVARAIENQVFAVCCNSCGKAEKTVYGGRSFIANPLGEISASAGENEEIISAECDVQKFTEICKKIPVFCDRRPELY